MDRKWLNTFNPQMIVKGFVQAGISRALDEVPSYATNVVSEQDVSKSSTDNDIDSDDSNVDHDTDVEESEDVIVLS